MQGNVGEYLHVEACVDNTEKAKELLDNLKALSKSHEITIELKIYPNSQACHTLI